MRTLLHFAAVCLVSATLSRAEIPAETRQDLSKLVPEIIRLLEAKDYVPLLQAIVPPDALKKLTEKQSMEKFAEEFGTAKAGKLLKVLKAVKDIKPLMSEADSKAEFRIPENTGSAKGTIVFQRIAQNWYIQN